MLVMFGQIQTTIFTGIAQVNYFNSEQEAYVLFMKDKYGFGTISIIIILKCLKALYGFWLEIWYSAQNKNNIYVIRVGRSPRKGGDKLKKMHTFYVLMKYYFLIVQIWNEWKYTFIQQFVKVIGFHYSIFSEIL